MLKVQKAIAASILEKVARNAAKASVHTRCAYIVHQPKQPEKIKNFFR